MNQAKVEEKRDGAMTKEKQIKLLIGACNAACSSSLPCGGARTGAAAEYVFRRVKRSALWHGCRHHQNPVEPVQQAEPRGGPKCKAWIGITDETADCWAQREPDSNRSTGYPERAGAFFPWRYVRDIGHRSWNAR